MLLKWRRRAKFYVIKLLRAGQGNHKVALGFVLGFFPCWFPTFGVGPALSIFFAKLLRTSVASSIVAAGVGSVAWPLLFFANYKVGNVLRAVWSKEAPIAEVDDLLLETVPEPDYAHAADHLNRLGDMGLNFMVGSIANSLVFSVLFYLCIRSLLARYRAPLLRTLRPKKKIGRTG
ncbi:DUF2062 domain-containing protein [Paenibacillus antri]|uniref:DUF2062 domain-containing protein n=1 Tax=Paenibacillus antri TaxID=2582848 RepID=A0A5R9GL78_9BACL|nr:DUF2062 domain-containing protein [Paenibacillus antri]TLS53833.1 DUF2062 domain-containing protein [Paenibacillus antri]